MLFRAGCNIGEIVTITGHRLRRAQDILDKYLARTSQLASYAAKQGVLGPQWQRPELREAMYPRGAAK
jgi:hypothetical protein